MTKRGLIALILGWLLGVLCGLWIVTAYAQENTQHIIVDETGDILSYYRENGLILRGILPSEPGVCRGDEHVAMTWTHGCDDGRTIELVLGAGGQVYWREAKEVEQP